MYYFFDDYCLFSKAEHSEMILVSKGILLWYENFPRFYFEVHLYVVTKISAQPHPAKQTQLIKILIKSKQT